MSERWKPEANGRYYYVNGSGSVANARWDDGFGYAYYGIGNCFRTEDEALAAAEKVRELLLSLHEKQPATNSSQLLKLTAEVFDRPDCPDWANYAAAGPDGTIWVYENEPKRTGRYWHQATGRFDDLTSVYTEAGGEILVQKEVTPILLTDKIKPGDWIYNHIDKRYEQVFELKDTTVRTVKYIRRDRRHSDWGYGQIAAYFDPEPIKVKPWPEWDAHKLVGKVIQDAKGNTELIMSWNVDQKKVYMDMHAVSLEELTTWWLDDKPCGVIESEEITDEDN